MEKKSMLMGIFLAVIIPGLGLIYSNNTALGILFLIIWVASLVMIFTGLLALFGLPLYVFAVFFSGICTIFSVKKYNKAFA